MNKILKNSTRNPLFGVCLVGTAHYLPPARKSVSEILAAEGMVTGEAATPAAIISRLGIESVHVCTKESSADLATKVATLAIEHAAIRADEIDVVVDFTSLPEDFVVPSWSLANKLQGDLGASGAFTLGFSGGGSTNLLVALKFAAALIAEDQDVNTALLVAGERVVGGTRAIGSPELITICGDGASALVLTRSQSGRQRILGTELWSSGQMHDVVLIPAGGFAQPLHYDNYKLVLDSDRFRAFSADQQQKELRKLCTQVLKPFGLGMQHIKAVICQNISDENRNNIAKILEIDEKCLITSTLKMYGHVQSSDIIFNYQDLISKNSINPGDFVLFYSHGFGFTMGLTLLQY